MRARPWSHVVLAMLAAEKVVQHAFVTWAFAAGRFDLRESVTGDYRWYLVIGAAVGVLFAVALVGLWRGRRWSHALLAGLATVDIAGEFIAQGTLSITITLSFVVAVVVLVLAVRALLRGPAGGPAGGMRSPPSREPEHERGQRPEHTT